MAPKNKGLGRGLDALIHESPAAETAPGGQPPATSEPLALPIDAIRPNPFQPRRDFEQEALRELTDSIREMGVLQPILVRKTKDNAYELIAGERRLTAARAVGLASIPALIREYTDVEALEVALVENLQREDLNILEEAEGYQALADRFGLTQDQIAQRVGKARATVTNALRVLKLPETVLDLIGSNWLSLGHAKALLSLEIPAEQELFAQRAVREALSVRALEQLIARSRRAPRKPRVRRDDIPESHLRYLTDKLFHHFGTGCRITPCATLANGKKTKGALEIEFYSNDELDRILSLLGITDEL